MIALCPDCNKAFRVSADKVKNKATVYCSSCDKNFLPQESQSNKSDGSIKEAKMKIVIKKGDAINKPKEPVDTKKPQVVKQAVKKPHRVIEDKTEPKDITQPVSPVSTRVIPSIEEQYSWEVEKSSIEFNWFKAFVIVSLILAGQMIFFEGYNFTQNNTLRPKLEQVCQWLKCELPRYKNLDAFEVVTGSFVPDGKGKLIFKAVINNQAAFKQSLPNIKLSLFDYDEALFAERIFTPKEYLPGDNQKSGWIGPDENINAGLIIAEPKTHIGGYHFDLVY